MFRCCAIIVSVYALTFSTVRSAPAAVLYSLTDVGTLNGSWSEAFGINASGLVVGQSSVTGNANLCAFLYDNETVTNLGTLGGSGSWALGINSDGLIVGSANLPGNTAEHAFLYSNGKMTDLGTLGWSGGDLGSRAFSINSSGQIVGFSRTTTGTRRAFLYSGGTMTDLHTLGGSWSQAMDINDNSQIVGQSELTGGGGAHAFLYSNGTMIDLGALDGRPYSYAEAVNACGQVAGNSTASGGVNTQAFLYSQGVMTGLGTLGGSFSYAYGMNDLGQVVGNSQTNTGQQHAALYSDGVVIDLNTVIDATCGWILQNAEDINNNGQICGWGIEPTNHSVHAFLLTPVPEPGTITLLMTCAPLLLGLALLWRKS